MEAARFNAPSHRATTTAARNRHKKMSLLRWGNSPRCPQMQALRVEGFSEASNNSASDSSRVGERALYCGFGSNARWTNRESVGSDARVRCGCRPHLRASVAHLVAVDGDRRIYGGPETTGRKVGGSLGVLSEQIRRQLSRPPRRITQLIPTRKGSVRKRWNPPVSLLC
jgi:hypothetical protein